jgi:hypothetical protein
LFLTFCVSQDSFAVQRYNRKNPDDLEDSGILEEFKSHLNERGSCPFFAKEEAQTTFFLWITFLQFQFLPSISSGLRHHCLSFTMKVKGCALGDCYLPFIPNLPMTIGPVQMPPFHLPNEIIVIITQIDNMLVYIRSPL